MQRKSLSKSVMLTAAIIAISTFMTLNFTGCGTSGNTQAAISVVGSTSVQPLAQQLADEFNKTQLGIKIDVQGIGSTAGIKAVQDGTCDIGMSSRELPDEEKKAGLTEYAIAIDGIAVIANPANKVSALTTEQIVKIYKGEITNWKDLGGDDKEIIVIAREDGSGTKGAFEELLKLQEKKDGKTVSLVKNDVLVAEGNGSVKANVKSKENAIGYISAGIVDNTVKALQVDGIAPTEANVKAKTYSLSRPFLMLTKGELKPQVKLFLDFILSEKGQAVVAVTYVPVK